MNVKTAIVWFGSDDILEDIWVGLCFRNLELQVLLLNRLRFEDLVRVRRQNSLRFCPLILLV